MDLYGHLDKRYPVRMPMELRETLLEFTMNCLLEQPERLVPYAQNYFYELMNKQTQIEYEGEGGMEECSEEASERALFGASDMDPDTYTRGRGRVIYSEGYNPEKDTDDDEANLPVYEKTDEQKEMLKRVTRLCLLFRAVDEDHLAKVIDVMFPIEVNDGDYVIKQYDDGDNFYIIEFGKYDVYIADEPGTEPNLIFSYNDSGSFGELALMYNMPRAATVKATTTGRLWAMDRQTFRKIVLKGAFKKRKMYEELISNVPMLQELTTYERMSLADALLPKVFEIGDVIMKEGDVADGMYFIEKGQVRVVMTDTMKIERQICVLGSGDYFGELALVKDQPRAATVYAVDPETKLAFLDRAAFERILGPCMEIMMRNVGNYEEQTKKIFAEGI